MWKHFVERSRPQVTLWRTRIAMLDSEGCTHLNKQYLLLFRSINDSTKVSRCYTYIACLVLLSFLWHCNPTRAMASSLLTFRDHTQLRTTVGRTPLDERSARRRDLYLTTHTTDKRQISMPRRNSNLESQQASSRRHTP